MARFINPYTDFGFKKLFGEEGNKDLLIDFLNQLLPEKHQIYDLVFKNTEKLPRSSDDRKAFFDIYCTSRSGEHFIVEMQKAEMEFFKDRALYYTTFPIQEQAKKGLWNFQLSAIYFIAILDFVHDEPNNSMKFRRNICLKDEDNEIFYDKLHFCFLQMPLFDKKEHELVDKFDKWVYFLKHLGNLEVIPEILNEPVFYKAFETAEIAKLKPRQAKQYQQSLLNYWSNHAVVETAHKEGHEEGFIEGKAEGLAEGEIKAKLEIAEKLKQQGMSLEIIMQLTSLTAQELN